MLFRGTQNPTCVVKYPPAYTTARQVKGNKTGKSRQSRTFTAQRPTDRHFEQASMS